MGLLWACMPRRLVRDWKHMPDTLTIKYRIVRHCGKRSASERCIRAVRRPLGEMSGCSNVGLLRAGEVEVCALQFQV